MLSKFKSKMVKIYTNVDYLDHVKEMKRKLLVRRIYMEKRERIFRELNFNRKLTDFIQNCIIEIIQLSKENYIIFQLTIN